MTEQENALSSPFGKWVQVAFWIMLFSINVYLGSIALGWSDAFYRSGLNVTCHVLNFYGLYSWIVPVYYERKRYFAVFLGVVLLLAVLTPFRMVIEDHFALAGPVASRFGPSGRIAFVLFTEVAIGAFASLIRLANDNEVRKQRIGMLEKMHLESELRFLKAQMNPHFLFNTINNIYSLILLKSEKASEALLKLSALLRYLLYETRDRVSLAKEFQTLIIFAELFQLKFLKPVNMTIDFQARQDIQIEPLVLIPILENAVKHSGLGVSADAFVAFMVCEENGFLAIHCDNSKTDSPVPTDAKGIGLDNIRKRLALAYPQKHTLDITETSDRFTVHLKISMT